MCPGARKRLQSALSAVFLSAALIAASDGESAADETPTIESTALLVAAELLDAGISEYRPPLTSDTEHARAIDPVLTAGTAIWIREALPTPPLMVMGGRVFTYRDAVYDPLDAPILKIRSIDDDQVVSFLIRVVISPESQISRDAAVSISFPTPTIFNARVEELTAWVGPERSVPSIQRPLEDSRIVVRVPVAAADRVGPGQVAEPITAIVEGRLVFGAYRTLTRGRFAGHHALPIDAAIASLARLESGRDFTDVLERDRLQDIANDLSSRSSTDYDRVAAVNSWVSRRLMYRETPASRSPLEALADQSGDCDDYTAIAVVVLRAMGIPARPAIGLLYDLDTLAAHAWVEAALETRTGVLYWFIVDPTLAGTTPIEERKEEYVQYKDRILLYPVRPTVSMEGMVGQRTVDVLLNWQEADGKAFTDPRELNRFIDLVIEGVDREISRGAERLAAAGLTLRRESASIAGSPYVLVDRPIAEKSPSRLQLRLENEERLVLDLTAADGSALESESDLEAIDRLRNIYNQLNRVFFAAGPAHANLELLFIRDRHSDRMRNVRLRIGRYLVEHSLDRILKRLAKAHLLTEKETAVISAVADASGGRNFYVLQELARDLPTGDSS